MLYFIQFQLSGLTYAVECMPTLRSNKGRREGASEHGLTLGFVSLDPHLIAKLIFTLHFQGTGFRLSKIYYVFKAPLRTEEVRDNKSFV